MKIPVLIALWLASVVAGLGILLSYKQTEGAAAVAPRTWPQGSTIELEDERATLVMLLHPRCPCSKASIEELAKLMTRTRGLFAAHAIFALPENAGEDWSKSELARRAEEIDGLTVHFDPGGVEARRFGAFVSGQTELYARDGALLFSGGLTPSRGHMGDNKGSAEIERLVGSKEKHAGVETSKVFGCELKDPP